MSEIITIEVAKGGFILTYPNMTTGNVEKEVFSSSRKLNQRLKEIIESLSLVPTDSEK